MANLRGDRLQHRFQPDLAADGLAEVVQHRQLLLTLDDPRGLSTRLADQVADHGGHAQEDKKRKGVTGVGDDKTVVGRDKEVIEGKEAQE